jgi:hypothetical protein
MMVGTGGSSNSDVGGSFAELLPNDRLTRERLQGIVDTVSARLRDSDLRRQSQRAVQAKVWHSVPSVSILMRELKSDEVRIRNVIQNKLSSLVYEFHSHTIDATLARAGITSDARLSGMPNSISSNSGGVANRPAPRTPVLLTNDSDLDLRCLDAKERLYMVLQHFGWLEDFFQSYPHHFYENSFSFVSRIPAKALKCRALVMGLGVGGSMACSGVRVFVLCRVIASVLEIERTSEGPSFSGSVRVGNLLLYPKRNISDVCA